MVDAPLAVSAMMSGDVVMEARALAVWGGGQAVGWLVQFWEAEV